MEGRADGSVTISLHNFVGEGIKKLHETNAMHTAEKKTFVTYHRICDILCVNGGAIQTYM